MLFFVQSITPPHRLWSAVLLALALAGGTAGCRTAGSTAGSGVLMEESALLSRQAHELSRDFDLEQVSDGAAGAGVPGTADASALRPGATIIIQAWYPANMLPGYPMEIRVPESGPVFLPHFGLVDIIGKTTQTLQQELLERFNVESDQPDSARIWPGEQLTIGVWLRDNVSMPPGFPYNTKVAADGAIFVPHIGPIQAAGKNHQTLQTELQQRFTRILVGSHVLVTRQESPAAAADRQPLAHVAVMRKHDAETIRERMDVEIGHHIVVLGHVKRPGVYPLRPGMRVRDAVALAGGLERYAHRNIFLVRGTATDPEVVRVDMQDIMRGKSLENNIHLAINDAIYVAPKALWSIADFIGTLLMPIVQIRDAIYIYDRFVE